MKTEPATPFPVCDEGPEAFKRFDATIGKLLSVSHAVLVEREKAYKDQAAKNPNKPGPKPKVKRRRVSSDRSAKS
jgi:hypothetical protein